MDHLKNVVDNCIVATKVYKQPPAIREKINSDNILVHAENDKISKMGENDYAQFERNDLFEADE